MRDFHCKNQRCKRAVAKTDGIDLYFDGKKVPFAPLYVGFACQFCGRKIHWTRGDNGKRL
jgi:hypothetical protein